VPFSYEPEIADFFGMSQTVSVRSVKDADSSDADALPDGRGATLSCFQFRLEKAGGRIKPDIK
jgi:hypothetical protein